MVYLPSLPPSSDSVTLDDSGFFARNNYTFTLPTPEQVHAEARRRNSDAARNFSRPPPVHYPAIGLTVKHGTTVNISEGRCLWAIRKLFGDEVPVPEVYGWATHRGCKYIYMQHISGDLLSDRWEGLLEPEKQSVCQQLRSMIDRLRCFKQPDEDQFIGNIGRQPLSDIVCAGDAEHPQGPFSSVKEFHDVLSRFMRSHWFGLSGSHPYREHLPDDVPIVFTHGDLHRTNVIISAEGEPRVVALIDWGQSGWLPSYWEYCKARWTAKPGEEWEAKYVPLIVDKHECYDYWDYFVIGMGM